MFKRIIHSIAIGAITSLLFSAPVMGQEVDYKIGYTTTNVNLRSKPNTDSKILHTFPYNSKIEYTNKDKDDWIEVEYDGKTAYMCKDFITKKSAKKKVYDCPWNSGYKSWMPYTAITLSGSPQKELQDEYAYTGTYGIRMVNGRYCVALGTYFSETTQIGRYFDLVLDNGDVIPCIAADIKDDAHTDGDNFATSRNGCMSEFIVDTGSLNRNAKLYGNIAKCTDEWDTSVSEVIIYEKNVLKGE